MNISVAAAISTFLALFNQAIARIYVLREQTTSYSSLVKCARQDADVFDIGNPENLQTALKMGSNGETLLVSHIGASYYPVITNGTLVKARESNTTGFAICQSSMPDLSESKLEELRQLLASNWPHPGNAYLVGFEEVKKVLESFK